MWQQNIVNVQYSIVVLDFVAKSYNLTSMILQGLPHATITTILDDLEF